MTRILDFKTEYRAGGKGVDYVLVAPSGEAMERTQTWQRVSKLDPSNVPEDKRDGLSYRTMAARWERIGPAYEAWKAGTEIPEEGTPLAAWSAVTPEQARLMRSVDLRTVEDVASATESTMARLQFPNAMRLRDLAKDWLDGRDKVETAEALRDAQERIKVMEEMLAAQTAPKRGPGRPRKTEAA
jgi:hypothetical protein